MRLKIQFLLALAILSIHASALAGTNFLMAADFSDLAFFEAQGITYKDGGQAQDALHILKNHGLNCIRLRTWTSSAAQAAADPYDYTNNLTYNLPLALRVKNAGLQFWLDFHYSDTWADPGHQTTPAAWANDSLEQLVQDMYTYNSNTIAAFAAEGAMPEYVQVGNEITSGMLWPLGQVDPNADGGTQWNQLGQLMTAARRGIHDAAAFMGQPMPKIVVHIDRGGDWATTSNYFNNLNAQGFSYDIIAESYYPFYQGALSQLSICLMNAANYFGKPVLVAETAFPWTNTCPSAWLPDLLGYPPDEIGQVSFLVAEGQIINSVPNGLAAGVSYWGGEFQAVPGVNEAGYNTASFWDEHGNLLPSLQAEVSIASPLTTGPPLALTMAASGATATSAMLGAQAYANGAPSTAYIEWGPTTRYGEFTTTNILAANYVAQNWVATISNLFPSTTYHFQEVVANDAGTNYGGDGTFVTPSLAAQPANLYQEDFGAIAGNGASLTFAQIGWIQVVPSLGHSSAGLYFAPNSVDVSSGLALPASAAYYYGAGTEIGVFYTTNGAGSGASGDSAFTSINPALYSNLTFSVETQQSYQGGNVTSWFAVQVGGAWYVSTTPMSAYEESAASVDFSLTSLVYNPIASNWANLTIGSGSVTLGQTASADLSGPITGIGIVASVNSSGGWDYDNLLIRAAAPFIVSQPANPSAALGGNASFTVGATGAPALGYQWQFNHTNLSGATNYFLLLTNVQASNAGPYRVVLTNSYGSVTSATAWLGVTEVPVSFATVPGLAQWTGGQFALPLTGLTGQGAVEIDASTNLLQWVPIFTNPAAFGSTTIMDPNAGQFTQRFYRAITP